MRPGYLGELDNYWFSGSKNTEEKKQAKMAEVMASRQVPSTGAAQFDPVVFLKKHPQIRRKPFPYYHNVMVEGPSDLKVPLTLAPASESPVDKYYSPWETPPKGDAPYRSKPWTTETY